VSGVEADCSGRGSSTPGGREDVVGGVQVVEGVGHAQVRHRLIDQLAQVGRGHAAVGQGRGGHDPEFGGPAGGGDRGELHEQPGTQVERVVELGRVTQDLVERPVVEERDQLRVGPRERRRVAEQLVVIGLRGAGERHRVTRPRRRGRWCTARR
jgi:hypothetical protein